MARKPDERLEELGGLQKLTPKELKYMQYIWKHPEGVSSEDIYAQFHGSATSKSNMLAKIANKGYLNKRQEGLHYIYTAIVSRAEYEQTLLCQQLKDLQRERTLSGIVAAFCGKEKLTQEQEEKVQQLLNDLEDNP